MNQKLINLERVCLGSPARPSDTSYEQVLETPWFAAIHQIIYPRMQSLWILTQPEYHRTPDYGNNHHFGNGGRPPTPPKTLHDHDKQSCPFKHDHSVHGGVRSRGYSNLPRRSSLPVRRTTTVETRNGGAGLEDDGRKQRLGGTQLFSNTAALLTVPTAASYLVKDQVDKLPASDQKDIKDLKAGLGNALGGSLQNSLGEIVGNTGDSLTSPYTGR
ncbi:hypothetical protein BJ546DRAFT_950862 [Cryomyces antarcticus]